MVTIVISAVALVFAAIAAWGAWRTVTLTHALQIEQRTQRIGEALVGMIIAAEEATPQVGQSVTTRSHGWDRAMHELRLCTATSVVGLTIAVIKPIDQLLNDRNLWRQPLDAMSLDMDAQRALKAETADLIDPTPLWQHLMRRN